MTSVLAALISLLAGIALLAACVTTLVALLAWTAGLQGRVYSAGIAKYLQGIRRRHFHDRGLNPRASGLRRQARGEAEGILRGGARPDQPLPRWAVPLAARLEAATTDTELLRELTDIEREELARGLLQLREPLEERWSATLLVISIACACGFAAVWPFDALVIFSAGLAGALFSLPMPGSQGWGLLGGGILLHQLAGVLVAGLLGGAFSAWLIGKMNRPSDEDPGPALVDATRKSALASEAGQATEGRWLGKDGQVVRVLNLSAGGFDTLMQLGVAHALLVIRGRAPDAVVGVSAGALNAAAIAAVLQAGYETDPEKRMLSRVARLRGFIEAARDAPVELVHAILPDTFQIDAHRALTPLRQPRFSKKERHQRSVSVVARSGLTRLYNDLLNLPFSVGTLTGILRRWLGLQAAGDLDGWFRCKAVQGVELVRLWVLVGENLRGTSILLRILGRVLLAPEGHLREKTVSAGDLISRIPFIRFVRSLIIDVACLMAITLFWITATILVHPLVAALTAAVWLWTLFHGSDEQLRSARCDACWGFAELTGLSAVWVFLAAAMLLIVDPLAPFSGVAWWILIVSSALTIVLAVVVGVVFIRDHPRSLIDRVLATYSLDDALLEPHRLRILLKQLFDDGYYPHKPMDSVVKEALHPEMDRPLEPDPTPKKVGAFNAHGRQPIYVGIAVGNTSDGALEFVAPDKPLVDALLAAVSVAPWLPAMEFPPPPGAPVSKRIVYIDGANIARDASDALFKLLRAHLNEKARVVHVYTVSPFPTSRDELGPAEEDAAAGKKDGSGSATDGHRAQRLAEDDHRQSFVNLVDVAWRAWRLRRFRDATLQRRLTELVTQTFPDGTGALLTVGENRYIKAWVTPIEPERDLDLNRRVLVADKTTRHRVIEEAIAQGCRAAMQVMIPHAIQKAERENASASVVPCVNAVKEHLKVAGSPSVRLPGSDQATRSGPGLSEICRQCRLRQPQADPAHSGAAEDDASQVLRVEALTKDEIAQCSPWPHESDKSIPARADRPYVPRAGASLAGKEKQLQVKALAEFVESAGKDTAWPKHSDGRDPKNPDRWARVEFRSKRPTVSFLFSGGVFRGVYQMGTLNALSLLGLRPDIIAGASVGSITAAMIAETFTLDGDTFRKGRIARLAAVFLGIDRLILTDRFADFVRALTIRAAGTRFSVRQVDRFLRKYDHPKLPEFDRNARQVIAGIERLLYFNPYQLNELVRAVRNGDTKTAARALRNGVQQFLDRMQIGEEALGAEALADLMDAYVPRAQRDAVDATFDKLRGDTGIQLFVTATNLTRGLLEVPGNRPLPVGQAATLRGAILASSAFPGVFRPRWSWEVYPSAANQEQFIDGGVMDNLPLDAVAAFLDSAASPSVRMIAPRPYGLAEGKEVEFPHLLVGASLEVNAKEQAFAFRPDDLMQSWRTRTERARQLSYNVKLDMYVRTQNRLRDIARHSEPQPGQAESRGIFRPLHMQVIPIKPEWLCGTFAAHPMLGFRRVQQARSIAHGCASTLLAFAQFADAPDGSEHRQRLDAWGVKRDQLPTSTSWRSAFEKAPRNALSDGVCWLRGGHTCPFSRDALQKDLKADPIPPETIDEIAVIHAECLKRETHMRRI